MEAKRRDATLTQSRWEGGRIRTDARGRPVFVIERMVNGKRYVVSTRTHTIRAALAQLARFEADPEGYNPRGVVSGEALALDETITQAFLAWSLAPKPAGGCANTRSWASKQKRMLAWWATRLRGRDIRAPRLTITDITAALDGTTDRANKIRVLKTFYGWLRTVSHRINAAEDPTLDVLRTPQAGPAQAKRKKVVALATIETVITRLAPLYGAALTVQAGTGWHTEEVIRFAASGWTEPARDANSAGVLVLPLHKRGDEHRSRVTTRVLAAAGVLLKHGSFSRSRYDAAVRSACDLAPKVTRFTPANMRHTVATWAVEAGADLKAVSDFEGHRSTVTTKRFYATHAAPVKVPTPL